MKLSKLHESSNRTRRISDLIQREIAQQLQQANDPRFKMVTVVSVDVSRDLANSNIFVAMLDGMDVKKTIDALNKAASYFRRLLAKNLELRTTPKLKFIVDDTARRGQHLSEIINNL